LFRYATASIEMLRSCGWLSHGASHEPDRELRAVPNLSGTGHDPFNRMIHAAMFLTQFSIEREIVTLRIASQTRSKNVAGDSFEP